MKILMIVIVCAGFVGSAYFFLQENNESSPISINSPEVASKMEEKETKLGQNNALGVHEPDENTRYDSVGDIVIDELPNVPPELEERYTQIPHNPNYPTLALRLSEMNARRHGEDAFSPEDVMNALEQEEPWARRSEPGKNLNRLSEIELNDGREFIDFNPTKIESLMPGDKMKIAINDIAQVFDVEVSKVKIFDDGNITWKGVIQGENGGDVSITQSSEVTIGSVILQDTDYTIASHGTDGWIADSGTLFKIDDPNIPDYVLLEDEHLHE